MIDEAGPKDSKGHTPSEPPKTAPKVPSQPVNPPKGSSITTIDEKPTPDKPQPIPNSPRWRRFKGWIAKSWRERKKSSFTDKVIMAATVAIAFYAFLQHIDSKYTGTQTDRIIVADERLATAMENSVKEAESALNASIEASRTDQRAWIGPGDAVTPQDLRVGGTPVFSVVMLNTGKTPALHIETSVIWKPTYPSEPFKPTYGAGLSQRSVFVLFPNNHGVTVYSRGQSAFTQANMDDLKAGKYTIWFYGVISYEDVFGKKHRTQFCSFYTGEDFLAAKPCNTYNYAD